MAQRQERDPLVALVLGAGTVQSAQRMQDVAVAEHRALGLAGGAGGVDQDRQVVGLARVQPLLPELRVARRERAAELAQRLEADHVRIAEFVQPLGVEHDDLAQAGQPRAHLERLVELLLVLDEQDARVRIGREVVHLRGRVGRIDAVRYTAGAERAEVGVQPLLARVGEDRDALRPAPCRARPGRARSRARRRRTAARSRCARRRVPSGASRSCRRAARRRSRTSSAGFRPARPRPRR